MFGGHDNNGQMQDNTAAAPNDGLANGSMSMPEPAATAPGAPMPSPGFDNPYPTVEPAVDTQSAGVGTPPAIDNATGTTASAANAAPDEEELLDIKQQALQQLTPLVGHLEQSPEDKFRTTMMMIQASDNQALIKDAYAAANAIQDEKVRAQALLDIVNEINYFTQAKNQQNGTAPQQ